MRPVILIPGMGGSILVRKGHEHRHLFNKKLLNNRWINIDVVKRTEAWRDDMSYDYVEFGPNGEGPGLSWNGHPITNCHSHGHHARLINHKPIVPYEFGSVRGVSNIVSEFEFLTAHHTRWLDNIYHHSYMATLAEYLEAKACYKDRVNLFACPYDFRLILDPELMRTTFEQIRHLIERAVQKNHGAEAVIVCHSAGGLLMKLFLTQHVSLEWRNRYISNVIYATVPFGGVPLMMRSVIYGEFYYSPLHRHYRDIVQRNSAIIMCLPNELSYDPEETFIRLPKDNLGIKDYHQLEKINQAFCIWRNLAKPLYTDLCQPLHSPTTIVIGDSGLDTPVEFTSQDLDTYPVITRIDSGDGIVPMRSMHAAEKIFDEAKLEFVTLKSSHVGTIRHPEFLRLVLEKII